MKRSLIFLLLLTASVAVAQLNRGTITGTVADASGAVIPEAKVVIRNTATNAMTRTETTAAGQYTVPNLPNGPYEVVIEARGFKRFLQSGLDLRVSDVLRLDTMLDIGSQEQTIEVSAEVSRVQSDSPQVGTSLTSASITDLPLSFSGARSPENFAYKLSPGVAGSSWEGHINGSTTASKEVLLDGASVSTYRAGHFGESSVSQEAVQEFKVQTSGMTAEYGRMQAGVFNFIMKSGANDLHGSGYGALRNEAFNANSFVNNFRGVGRPMDRKQNFAGSFGGPVVLPKIYNGKNKTFFYITYERYRERTGGFGAPSRTVPLPEFYDGDFSRLLGAAIPQLDALDRQVLKGAIYDPNSFRQLPNSTRWVGEMFPGNVVPKSRFSEVSKRVNALAAPRYFPTVKDPDGRFSLVNNAVFPVTNTPVFDQHQFSIKGDQVIHDRHRISGSYTRVVRPRLLLDAGGLWDTEDPEGGPLSKARRQEVKSHLARLAWDWTITPRLLINVNASYNRMVNPNVGAHADIDGAKELGIKNLSTWGYPTINWGGGPFVTPVTPGDPQKDMSVYGASGIMATASFTTGKHFIKYGIDHRRNQLNSRPTQGGSFNFAARGTAIPNETFSGSQIGYSFASYLLGIVDSAGLSAPLPRGGRRRYYGLFVQDDWKLHDRLTLNLGLRWEFQPPYTEAADRMATWNMSKTDPVSGMKGAYDFAGSCAACTGKNYFGEKNYKAFSPRIGLAWQPMKDWTVRGAYGIFYEGDIFNDYGTTPGASAFPWQASYNLAAASTDPWRGIFNWDAGLPLDRRVEPAFNPSAASSIGVSMVDPTYGNASYTQQWNVNIQRRLTNRLLLDLGYIGNKSTGIKNAALTRYNQIPWSAVEKYGRTLTTNVRNPAEAAANGVAYPYAGFSGTVAGALRQFPQLQGTSTFGGYGAALGMTTYNSLQITIDQQPWHGLSVYANYVWSKSMGNTLSSFSGDNGGPLDYYNLKLEKAVAPFDYPHMFKGMVQYELPFGRGKAVLGSSPSWVTALVGGWQVSGIMNYFSGGPLGFGGASSPLPSGWNGGQRPNIAAGDMHNASYNKDDFNYANVNAASNLYLNKALFSDPAPLTLGTAAPRYTTIRGFGTISEDVGLLKNFRIHEKYRAQIRSEFLNLFNRHQLGGINTTITSPQFGQVTSVSGNRTIQFGLRLDF
ncbi:MAG: TonB-dependent receptor [Bryobacteraceae bacterium]|nr:TonB-dependent receptor [Bryobacteraceae bacterium]